MKTNKSSIILFFILGTCLILVGSTKYLKESQKENLIQKQETIITTPLDNVKSDIEFSNNSSGQQTTKKETKEFLLLNENINFTSKIERINQISSEISPKSVSESIEHNSDFVKQTSEFEGFSKEEKAEYYKYLSVFKMRWDEKYSRSEELKEAVEKLSVMGDKVIDPIINDFNQPSQTFAFRHKVVQLFEKMRSEKARNTLLKIALGKTIEAQANLREWAASRYILSLDDKSQAKYLLSSKEIGVINTAVLALKGMVIDKEILSRLIELLGMEIKGLNELYLCWNISYVMAEDPSTTYAEEKVSSIITAINSVYRIPKANDKFPDNYYTYAEMSYNRYIDALGKIRGADMYLQNQTSRVSGKTLYCVLIARARRSDATIKNRLVDILEDKDADIFRDWASSCFNYIGTPNDLPLLQKIADSDPLERANYSSAPIPSKAFFPVRVAAQKAIKKIQEKFKQ